MPPLPLAASCLPAKPPARVDETTHYGLIAQEVREVLDDMGLEEKDFNGWSKKDSVRHEREIQHLAYTEFISPLIKAVQELSAKVTALEAQIN